MTAKVWDVIVVGGGIIGLNAAYHSAKAGRSTLLLEQVKFHVLARRVDCSKFLILMVDWS